MVIWIDISQTDIKVELGFNGLIRAIGELSFMKISRDITPNQQWPNANWPFF